MIVTLPDVVGSSGVFVDGDWVESKDQDPEGDVRLVQLADIGDGEFLDKSERYLTSTKAAQLRCTFLEPGDILIARMPDPIGRACIFPGGQQSSVTVVDVCIVRPDKGKVCPNWLLHRINSERFRKGVGYWLTGTTRQRISRGNLSKIEFDLPPLDQQRRIATILDKADALRRQRKRAIQLVENLTRSIFLDMFGDPKRNAKNWDKVALEKVGDIQTGRTPPTSDATNFNGDVPFLTPGDLESGGPPTRFVSRSGAKFSKSVEAGAAMVCCIGATIGKMDIAVTRSTFNQQINAVQWSSRIMPEFGLAALRFQKDEIIGRALSTTLPILKKSEFQKIEIIAPPLPLQTQFDQRVASWRKLRSRMMRGADRLEQLSSSLQHRAFSGYL